MTTETISNAFRCPTKRISSQPDVTHFQESLVFSKITNFIEALGTSVISKPNSFPCVISENVQRILDVLIHLDGLVDQIEPYEQRTRFGNLAYREKVIPQFKADITELLGDFEALEELQVYFQNSFGDPTRIDYGSGHELNFLAFLLCLNEIGYFSMEDHTAIVLKIFTYYLELCRKIQLRYCLEPAGSKGVWGLDDYQFLPFYFGAAQLIENPDIIPREFNKSNSLRHADDFLFLRCIQFIHQIKGAPQFPEHSPTLFSLTTVPSWRKMKSGMLKMYKGEVMTKFPVIQHFFFGSILNIDLPNAPPKRPERSTSLANVPFAANNFTPVTRAPWANESAGMPMRGNARVAEHGTFIRREPSKPEQRN